MISHRRLQSEILKSEDFLSSTFTKAELEKLCLAYKSSRGARFTCSLLSSGDPKFPNVEVFSIDSEDEMTS
jgi:hypothetical protein